MANPKVSNGPLFAGNESEQQEHLPHSGAISEMENALWNLCDQLDHSTDVAEMNCAVWADALKKYIVERDDRIYYSAISNYVFQMNEERFPDFLSNMDKVVGYAEKNLHRSEEQVDKDTYRTIIKFYDHINLAHQQQVTFSNKKEDLREDVKNEVHKTLDPKVSEITKDMTSQLVGLISIFTALSFIVFGGISSLENMVTSLQGTLKDQQSVLPILILAMAWAFCMMNLLFGFMYFVIRITTLEKPVDENAANVVQRYPVVFLCNYIILALLVLFSGMWFAEVNAVGKSVFEFFVDSKHSTWTFWIFVVLFIVFFGVLGWFLWKWYGSKKSSEK